MATAIRSIGKNFKRLGDSPVMPKIISLAAASYLTGGLAAGPAGSTFSTELPDMVAAERRIGNSPASEFNSAALKAAGLPTDRQPTQGGMRQPMQQPMPQQPMPAPTGIVSEGVAAPQQG